MANKKKLTKTQRKAEAVRFAISDALYELENTAFEQWEGAGDEVVGALRDVAETFIGVDLDKDDDVFTSKDFARHTEAALNSPQIKRLLKRIASNVVHQLRTAIKHVERDCVVVK